LQKLVHDLRRGGAAQVLVANTPYLDRLPVYLACQSKEPAAAVRCPTAPAAHLDPAGMNRLVDAYNSAITTVVQQEGAVLVDLHARGEIPDTHPEWVSADGFHPSSAGYAAIARTFAESYRSLKTP
ncbi:MAG TPA: GDSL-type esterase/lipase family protein, partial [Candidatus Dormibacteraeota bacterium]|nr:GDSL-type esterase/lipase family protein [Candidatus Dormibacteraeota bacterium]